MFHSQPLIYHSASASSVGSYSTNNGHSSNSAATSSSAKRSKDLYAVKLAIQAQSKRSNHPHQPERPTTLHLKPDRQSARSAVERLTHHRSSQKEPSASTTAATTTQHRRTQSESHAKSSRLNDIRPRYLEPKLQVAQLPPLQQSASTTSAVRADVHHQSSSGDSSTRNSKLALNKRLVSTGSGVATATATNTKSSMSRDSLASPLKQPAAKGPQCKVSAASEVDLSIDSLGGSMHSSIKSSRSNKSMSQESLVRFNAEVRAKNLQANNGASRLRQPIHQLLLSSSNEHSPGSATTATKSSRLSSVTSATSSCSPRDVALHRNGLAASAPVRRSFVSAKSREILAAKQNAVNRTEPARSATVKSSSTGSVPTKRPVSFPTTLHLRRTAKLSPSQADGAATGASPATSTKSMKSPHPQVGTNRVKPADQHKSKPKLEAFTKATVGRRIEKSSTKVDAKAMATTANNRIKGSASKDTTKVKPAPLEIELDVPIVNDADDDDDASSENVAPRAATRVESKLERSSTFCKDSSGLNPTVSAGDLKVLD